MSKWKRATICGAVRMVGLAAAAAGAGAALAGPPELRSEGGLLVLPNVRVETAAQPMTSAGAAADAGMRAYKDRVTGELRPALPEELLQEAAPRARSKAAAAQIVVNGRRRTAALDETFMSYTVVRKGADGRIDTSCVQGEASAHRALQAAPKAASEEDGHAH